MCGDLVCFGSVWLNAFNMAGPSESLHNENAKQNEKRDALMRKLHSSKME